MIVPNSVVMGADNQEIFVRLLAALGPIDIVFRDSGVSVINDLSSIALSWCRGIVAILFMTSCGITFAIEPGERVNHEVIVIGASYAADWPIEVISGYQVFNAGSDGAQSHQMLLRFETDVVARQPEAVVIWGFINDVFRNPMSEIDATEARIRASYLSMIKTATANDIKPFIVTEVTIRPKKGFYEWIKNIVGRALGKEGYQSRVNKHVRRTNQWLREIGIEKGLIVLDFERVLTGDDGFRDARYSRDDGSHISDEGYQALSEYARPILQANIK